MSVDRVAGVVTTVLLVGCVALFALVIPVAAGGLLIGAVPALFT